MVTIGIFVAATAMQRDTAGAVVKKSLLMLKSAETVVGSFVQSIPGKPGLARGEFHLKKGAKLAVFGKMNSEICDGMFRTSIDNRKGTYTVRDVRVFELPYLPGFEGFTMTSGMSLAEKFSAESEGSRGPAQPENVRMATLDGKPVVAYSVGGSNVFLNPVDGKPVGADFIGENRVVTNMRFLDVKIGATVPDSAFKFRGADDMREQKIVERGMMRVGQRMPISNIEAMTMLNKEMVGKRSTIVLFFDDKNAPSGEMLKKMFDISKNRPKDIAVVGVTKSKNWRKMFTGKLNFTVIEDAPLTKDSLIAQFGITNYPTMYVIDQNSEATYVQIGMNDSELNPILRGLGFSIP